MSNEKAPWPDYEGNDLFAGDIIRHPSGQEGIVRFMSEQIGQHDQWRVDYDGVMYLSRLCLQVGEKGQAVKVLVGAENHNCPQCGKELYVEVMVRESNNRASSMFPRCPDDEGCGWMGKGKSSKMLLTFLLENIN